MPALREARRCERGLSYRRRVDERAHRFDRLDALRGFALVWMALYHLAFDLSRFGLIERQDFNRDAFWLAQRSAILSLFLFCAGAATPIALARGQDWRRLRTRWAKIAAGAAAVSLASWLMFPRSWISFGVLHAMALMTIVARVAAPLGRWLWPAGLACIVLPRVVQHPFFDTRWTNWVGLVTRKPLTEDYVPLLPWLGVVLWGVAAAQWLLQRHPHWLERGLPAAAGPLAALGRWSLTFYLLHHPVLIGIVLAVGASWR